MEEFHNIFGPELKSVTGDPKRIDDVLARVEALVVPFENVRHFYVFMLITYFESGKIHNAKPQGAIEF